MVQRGQFITLEGGEGAGKSTLANAIADRLGAEGFDVVRTREPGGAPAAEAIRELLLTPGRDWVWGSLAEALLFNAARAEHLDQLIRPALADGKWVLCDRFADSTRAYQLAGSQGLLEEVSVLERMVVGNDAPGLTLVLDIPPELGRERMMARGGEPDAFETRDEAYHQRVRDAFLAIAKSEPDRCVVIDARRTSEQVLAAAWRAIAEKFGLSSS